MITQNFIYWIALIVAVISNIASNISFKMAMSTISTDKDKAILWQIIEQKLFWIGILFAGSLLCSYLFAIRTLPVSIAYVFVTSLAMVGLIIAERIIFGTTLGMNKFMGVALVIVGVILLSRSS